jgi:hypothetical protein
LVVCIPKLELGNEVNPVTNQAFTKTLDTVLKRPTIFPMPALVEMGLTPVSLERKKGRFFYSAKK